MSIGPLYLVPPGDIILPDPLLSQGAMDLTRPTICNSRKVFLLLLS
jgi:hypothetical protein